MGKEKRDRLRTDIYIIALRRFCRKGYLRRQELKIPDFVFDELLCAGLIVGQSAVLGQMDPYRITFQGVETLRRLERERKESSLCYQFLRWLSPVAYLVIGSLLTILADKINDSGHAKATEGRDKTAIQEQSR